MIGKVSFGAFAKAQLSAFIGGLTDYGVMIACTELLHIHYTISILISGTIGAVVNFSINRSWSFRAAHQPIGRQLYRFCLMVAGSITLKSAFTCLLTETAHLDYRISRLCIELLVSLGFNYPLQKYWVFGKTAAGS